MVDLAHRSGEPRGDGAPAPGGRRPPIRWLVGAAVLVIVAVLTALALVSRDGGATTSDPGGEQPGSRVPEADVAPDEAAPQDPGSDVVELGPGEAPEGYPFSDDSIWRDSLRDAPVHENSEAIVDHLAGTVEKHYGGIATFNLEQYNVAYYEVDGSTPVYDVQFDDCQDKGGTPSGLFDGDAHFVDVPIPDGAEPAEGRDGALVLYSPVTDQLWEFWRASRTDDGWEACWGGRIDDVSSNPGYFDGNFGTTATGLSHAGGMISIADMEAGSIEHTMALLAAEPATWKNYSWPAQRSDGFSDDPDAVPEGLRLRLSADVDVDSLDLHPVAEMVALAAQEHGFVVVDKAGATGVYTESGSAVEKETGEDPWDEYLGGTPSYEVMAGFPWDELEAMPVDYGKP